MRILVKAIEVRCTVTEWLRSQNLELQNRRQFVPTSVAAVQALALETFLRTDVVLS